MAKIIPEVQAKQGRSGKRVLLILVVALALLMIGWIFIEFYGAQIEDDATGPVVETERNDPPAVELQQPPSGNPETSE